MKIFKRGFTLVELLIIIVIITILAVAGLAFFGNFNKSVKIQRGKGDVNAIARAMEVKYNSGTNQYQAVSESDFASGSLPKAPIDAHYIAAFSSDMSGFRVCANLSDTTTCLSSSCYCFCVSSAQGSFNEVSPIIFYENP
ncbi:MAG: prepilin-type N-terminal cleavage/methylation domain-containing protein [Patescibacteria group bacterium]